MCVRYALSSFQLWLLVMLLQEKKIVVGQMQF